GQPIKRLEVAQGGVMTEQIAIPKDEWRERQASQTEQQEQSQSSSLVLILIIALLGGGVFILHKTGKLQPMLQNILALIRRDKSKQS
ncbi:hypothetical protein HYZ76_01505, partial [Candidatus Falkowbacteria bacterium]|nr:hypothetical protein [Candidatus Falkowbacteria bacterium]